MDIIQKKREVINELVRKYEGDKLKAIDFISSDVLFEITGYGDGNTGIIVSGPRKKLEPIIREYFGPDQVDLIDD